jgi:N-acetylmuramoyl-L-alanine amidase
MRIKTTINYSPNFNPKKRTIRQIKFIIFHYTGMKKESAAISRLTNIQSEVSSHYLIKKNGDIVVMVPDLYIAWHAGKSSWKSFKSLNKNSIGIEISNPGHENNYLNFSKKQVQSIIYLSKSLLKNIRLNQAMYWVIQILHHLEKKILVKNFHGDIWLNLEWLSGTHYQKKHLKKKDLK